MLQNIQFVFLTAITWESASFDTIVCLAFIVVFAVRNGR